MRRSSFSPRNPASAPKNSIRSLISAGKRAADVSPRRRSTIGSRKKSTCSAAPRRRPAPCAFTTSRRRKSRRRRSSSSPTRKRRCTSATSASSKTSFAPSTTLSARRSASSSASASAIRDHPEATPTVTNEHLPLHQSPANCYDSGVPLPAGSQNAKQRRSSASRHGEKTLPHRRSQPIGGFETVRPALLGNRIPHARTGQELQRPPSLPSGRRGHGLPHQASALRRGIHPRRRAAASPRARGRRGNR